MKRKIIRGGVKAIAFIVCFAVIFFAIQPIFEPKDEEAIGIVGGFYSLAENSLDVLFLGPSQMFCGVNAQRLTDQYGISSYDFGAPYQLLPESLLYLQEALKTQNPKVVMVEICHFFSLGQYMGELSEQIIAWNYLPLKFSSMEFEMLQKRLNGNAIAAAKYLIFPLWKFHSRWNSLNKLDFFTDSAVNVTIQRGFLRRDSAVTMPPFAYTGEGAGEEREVPELTKNTITSIVNLCEERGIEVIFFKAPVTSWTRNDSKAVKAYMAEQGLAYLELNDYLSQLNIDVNTDFWGGDHLNTSGANKTTDFIAQYLMDHYSLGRQETQ